MARLGKDERREQLLKLALSLAVKHQYTAVTSTMLAKEAGVSVSLIPAYFGKAVEMRSEIIKLAMAECCIPVIAQAVANKHSYVAGGLAPTIKRQIAEYLVSEC